MFHGWREIWCVDFEFHQPDGEIPKPICMVARELRSNRLIRQWLWGKSKFQKCPFSLDAETLFVAYQATAELTCHLALGWDMPERILDLCIEFKNLTNGVKIQVDGKQKRDLLAALVYFGLPAMDAADKKEMRDLCIAGGPFTRQQESDILDYCQTDVDALIQLLPLMEHRIDLGRALIRGRYMAAAAKIENTGTPIDAVTLTKLRNRWEDIKGELVRRIDVNYEIYNGTSFVTERFREYLVRSNIPWPLLPSGALEMTDDTFRTMAVLYPQLSPLQELRGALSGMRLNGLTVGKDGRNRTNIWPFTASTGRNQPSNTRFIFGPSRWMRGLIKPPPGRALAYIDYSQQEFGIAAALSGDVKMMEAYHSGDPYLSFAKQAGAVPPDATKQSHPEERGRFKMCVLAVQYGMGEQSLARKIKQSEAHARELLRLHRQTYRTFWQWSDAVEICRLVGRQLQTEFGWQVRYGSDINVRSARNFPVQGNGSEMLRAAICLMVEAGIMVCAPVHDAVLIEGPANEIEQVTEQSRDLMAQASKTVLAGFEIKTDSEIIKPPERYMDEAGKDFWNRVIDLLGDA